VPDVELEVFVHGAMCLCYILTIGCFNRLGSCVDVLSRSLDTCVT
jgi:hypothetical protein